MYYTSFTSKFTVPVPYPSLAILIIIYCLTSNIDPMWPMQTTLYIGETCKFIERKPLICWGRKNPMSHLSRMKNPGLLCLSVAAALQVYGYVLSSLNVQTPWEPLLPSLAYLNLRFTQLGLANRLLCFIVVSHILTTPCMLSLIDHCYIRLASPPLELSKA